MSTDEDRRRQVNFEDKLDSRVLTYCRSSDKDTRILTDVLLPETVVVRKEGAKKPAEYKLDIDYTVATHHGSIVRTITGAIPQGGQVYCDYQTKMRRLDTLVIDPANNRLVLIAGTPARAGTEPPPVSAEFIPVANMFSNQDASPEILPIYSLLPPEAEPSVRSHWRSVLKPTVDKMKAGKAVTIVFWGDSITMGYDATSEELSFPGLVTSGLKQRYPNAKITALNKGIGGTNTIMRLAHVCPQMFLIRIRTLLWWNSSTILFCRRPACSSITTC